jgi:hypothetical protein
LSIPESVDRSIVLNQPNELDSYLRKAFQSGSVDLQIATYAGETFHLMLSRLFQDVLYGQLRLYHLQVRLLLPDYDGPMAVPCIAEPRIEDVERKADEDEHEYEKRKKKIVDAYKTRMKETASDRVRLWQNDITRIRRNGLVSDADLSVRRHELSPSYKFIIINNATAFFGLYPIDRTPDT